VTVPGVSGDFNDDGAVDAADYILWRKVRDTEADLPNDGGLTGAIGSDHYDLWQENIGSTDNGGGQAGQVPEPGAAVLLVLGIIGLIATRRGC
jgi:hypothetical protein